MLFHNVKLARRAAQRFALPALGQAAGRRPTGKMLRRRKMLGIAPESPASGARFVGQHFIEKTHCGLSEPFLNLFLIPLSSAKNSWSILFVPTSCAGILLSSPAISQVALSIASSISLSPTL